MTGPKTSFRASAPIPTRFPMSIPSLSSAGGHCRICVPNARVHRRRALAEEKGWEPGDVITIEGDIYAVDIELTLRGFFTHPTDEAAERVLYFDWQYVEEALGNPGQINSFYVLLDSPDNMNETITQAEAMFENSPDQVRAETEAAFFLSFLEMMGNIQFLFRHWTCCDRLHLLITVNTMAMAARERTTEVACCERWRFTRSVYWPSCV